MNAGEARAKGYTPTPDLRFVEREEGMLDRHVWRVLQQRYCKPRGGAGDHCMWVDVPSIPEKQS